MKLKHIRRDLRKIGRYGGVVQIAQSKSVIHSTDSDQEGHELVTEPLVSPTGPGGAAGFRNRNGSQIAKPEVTNVYLGPFWGDRTFVDQFSSDLLTHGYLDPLAELGAGTGPGTFLGSIDGPDVSGQDFPEEMAQQVVSQLADAGKIAPNVNSLYVMILPDGVVATMGTDSSCSAFCGYHDAFTYNGTVVAYAVLPSTLCRGCGGQIGDFTAVYAHELAEAATDKVPGQGWVADDGQENGDLEAWILKPWGPPINPNLYTIQGYYTNERGNTIGAWH